MRLNTSFDKPLVGYDHQSYRACAAVDSGNVGSECGSASACGTELCDTASLHCAPKLSVDHNDHCTVTADHSTTAASGGQSVENCSRLNNLSAAVSCSRLTVGSQESTNVMYKLEHLDVSGCWRITDLSAKYVFYAFIEIMLLMMYI